MKILAEWSTAGFNTCPDCADLEGRIFTIKEIDGLIPLHPNCRCIAIPAGVGEDKSKTNKEQRDATIGGQYKNKDGVAKKRGLYKKQSGKKVARKTSSSTVSSKSSAKKKEGGWTFDKIEAREDEIKKGYEEFLKQLED